MEMDHRSPLESIFGIIGGLPQGHDKPVKHALYNAVALLLLFLCCAATWALFMILEPFVKPLMWAVLVGSALHPLKRSLRDRFQAWFQTLEVSNTPVVLAVVLLPVNILNDLSDFIGGQLLKRFKYIIAVCVAIPTFLVLYHYTPRIMVCLLYKAYFNSFLVLSFLIRHSTWSAVSLILLLYISLTFLLWKPENNTKFHYVSIGIWLLLSCCLAHQFGSLEMPVFILLQVILFGGFASEVYNTYKTLNLEGHPTSILDSMSLVFHEKPSESHEKSEEELLEKTNVEELQEDIIVQSDLPEAGDRVCAEPKNPYNLELFEEPHETKPSVLITNQGIHVIQKPPSKTFKKPPYKRSFSQPQFFSGSRLKGRSSLLDLTRKLSLSTSTQNLLGAENYGSGFYLYCVLWACVIMVMWKNLFLLPLLAIPIVFYIVKHVGQYFGLWTWLTKHVHIVSSSVAIWCTERHDALVPVPIRGLYNITHKLNAILKATIKESIDTVASCVVISALIVFLVCGSVFIVFQIYAETIMMVQITGNVINQAVVDNPELRQMLPPAWDETVGSILDNAYQYGREGISKAVRSMMADGDAAKSHKLETQVLELWDRLYQSWMSSNDSLGPKVTSDAVKMSWDNFLTDLQKSQDLFNLSGLLDFAKQNLGTLMSVLESIWNLVKGNIGLLLSSISAFLSVILGGGTAVLNFILNGIVFLTTLFYLLSSSGDLYKPVEFMTNFSASGRRCGHALEAAINGVFTASFKMASFYGLWTWFIHNLFGVKIVYLPTTFATILGAVPFLGTYWACIPAILDLWLAQDRGIAAITFAVFQFLPTSIVDTTIYKEIKGSGHPYLTGLAIAGGIFCLGVEGAIIGPLLLCGLYVAIDLSSNLFKESPSADAINLRLQLQDR